MTNNAKYVSEKRIGAYENVLKCIDSVCYKVYMYATHMIEET